MRQLWVEQYRPTNKEDYVFKDEKQRKQIDKWLSSGALPHMLLSGSPGTGKCLAAETMVKVRLTAEIDGVMQAVEHTLPIIEVFRAYSAENIEYETPEEVI